MIRFQNVWKSFSGKGYSVRNISLEVQEGETLVILGKSGSGKTTTLKLINRLIDPTKGSISIDGQDIVSLDPIQLRRNIGYAVQEVGLFPHMNVEENIGLIPKLLGWSSQKIDQRTDQMLQMVGLDTNRFRQAFPLQLSGGQRQRVGLARALAADPPIVLMDEPFGALDPLTKEQVQREFLEIESKIKKTVVFVTHDLFEAVTMGDRIALMDQGELVEVATPKSFVENPPSAFADEFLGRHRFQLSLFTKTVSECLEPTREIHKEQLPKLSPNTTLIEALDYFKECRASSLSVFSGPAYVGCVKKAKLLEHILDLLMQKPQRLK